MPHPPDIFCSMNAKLLFSCLLTKTIMILTAFGRDADLVLRSVLLPSRVLRLDRSKARPSVTGVQGNLLPHGISVLAPTLVLSR